MSEANVEVHITINEIPDAGDEAVSLTLTAKDAVELRDTLSRILGAYVEDL